jgi:hypothetical protein
LPAFDPKRMGRIVNCSWGGGTCAKLVQVGAVSDADGWVSSLAGLKHSSDLPYLDLSGRMDVSNLVVFEDVLLGAASH